VAADRLFLCASSLRQSLAGLSMSHSSEPHRVYNKSNYLTCISKTLERYARAIPQKYDDDDVIACPVLIGLFRIELSTTTIKHICWNHGNRATSNVMSHYTKLICCIAADYSRLRPSAAEPMLARRACDTKRPFRNRAHLLSSSARLHTE
jgi:hypothetical protein